MKDKITAIIRNAEKNSLVNHKLQLDHSLSQSYPEGIQAYFKNRIHELKHEIAHDTMIGHVWAQNYFNTLTTDWINKYIQIELESNLPEPVVFEQFEKFMRQYFNLKSYENFVQNLSDNDLFQLVIRIEYINLIYDKYKEYFSEDLSVWSQRFNRNGAPVPPIAIDAKATEGSNKLILIAILAAIQETTGAAFDFEDFVLNRFGIQDFEKTKSIHKEKQTFRETLSKCRAIMKK
ncbi:MAG TPA: hypothetical protein PLM01_01215 [Bacteroidales bacterium]|nr:hypothetical protein [Bacteroidales bacterium]HQJ81104.1 hypothetical protein [Bacteroidales bacterium]